jgi:hypothetical protein
MGRCNESFSLFYGFQGSIHLVIQNVNGTCFAIHITNMAAPCISPFLTAATAQRSNQIKENYYTIAFLGYIIHTFY